MKSEQKCCFVLRARILLLFLGCLALLMVPWLEKASDRLLACLQDAAHFPLFAFMFVLLFRLWPAAVNDGMRVLLSLGALVAVAFMAEMVQPFIGRTAGWEDIAYGLAGSVAAACAEASGRAAHRRGRRALAGAAGALVLAALLPSWLVAMDRVRARLDFPVLASFEQPMEQGRWMINGCRADRVADHATDGRCALRVEVTNAAPYPGLFLTDAPRDWRGWRRVCLDVFIDGAAGRRFWLRIDDRPDAPYADRAQDVMDAGPGVNRLCLSLDGLKAANGRSMDLSRVISFGLFFDEARVGDRIRVDRVVLAP